MKHTTGSRYLLAKHCLSPGVVALTLRLVTEIEILDFLLSVICKCLFIFSFVCICVDMFVHVSAVPSEAGRASTYSGVGVTGSCEPLNMSNGGPNLGPLEEQYMFVTREPSLRPLSAIYFFIFVLFYYFEITCRTDTNQWF